MIFVMDFTRPPHVTSRAFSTQPVAISALPRFRIPSSRHQPPSAVHIQGTAEEDYLDEAAMSIWYHCVAKSQEPGS